MATVEEQVAALTQQVAALAADRNSYKQRMDAAEAQLAGGGGVPLARDYSGHPLAPLGEGLQGWDPQSVDAYYQRQVDAKGYLTPNALGAFLQTPQGQQVLGPFLQQAYLAARNDGLIWRQHDQLLQRETPGKDGKPYRPYADLGKYDSDLAKKTAEVLRAKTWGEPMHEKHGSFATDWRFPQGPQALEWAADLAQKELENAQAQAAASTATATAAQNAAQLGASPVSTGGGAAPTGRPDFANMQTPEQIVDALDAAQPAGATP